MTFSATTGEVRDSLRVSVNTLARMRSTGVLQPSVHYIAAGIGLKRPCLRWDLAAVEKTLLKRGKQIIPPKLDCAPPVRKKAAA